MTSHRPRHAELFETLEPRTFLSSAVSINANVTYQTIAGFGASMTTDFSRKEYFDPKFFDRIVNDLGATIARASIQSSFEQTNDNNDPKVMNLAGYNANAIAQPMAFFQQLKARGVNQFVTSLWSPPWWMKTNQATADGGMLNPERRGEFAEYLAALITVAKKNFGIDLSAVSPQNEPYFVEPYASALYNPWQFYTLTKAVQQKFSLLGITTKYLVPEDLIFEDRIKWFMDPTMQDPATAGFVAAVAGHGLGGHWAELRNTIAPYNKPFWMTETSGQPNTWDGAMDLALSLHDALAQANASAYLYWQWSEPASSAKSSLMIDGQPTSKYYVARQYFRYIRPGMKRVDARTGDGNLRVSSYKDPATGRMTIELSNRGSAAADVNFTISGAGLPSTYRMFRSSATENCVALGNVSGGGAFAVNIPGSSVVTLTSMPELTPRTATTAMSNVPVVAPWDIENFNALHAAALKGDLAKVKSLIASGADVNLKGPNGWTALHAAAACPYGAATLIIDALVNAGANVNATDNNGWTPLHIAAQNGIHKYGASWLLPVDKINKLIARGAAIDARDLNGRTPLIWAAMCGRFPYGPSEAHPSMVEALLLKGANPNLTDSFGQTALDYSGREGYRPIKYALQSFAGKTAENPYHGAPQRIGPNGDGVNAEDFDHGGEGVGYHDTDAANLGGEYRPTGVDLQRSGDGTDVACAVTSTRPGEWLKYTVDVITAKAYDFIFRYANPAAGAKFHLEVDGVNVTGSPRMPATAGWTTYTDITRSGITLAAGKHVFRLVMDVAASNGYVGNFNGFSVVPAKVVLPPGTITTSTAAYVRDGTFANSNFAFDPNLAVKKTTQLDYSRESYLKFDLSGFTAINTAKLRLFGKLSDASLPSVQTSVYSAAHTGWSETSIIWNTRPVSSINPLATTTITGIGGQWFEWDITAYLKSEKAAGHNLVTLVLKNPAATNPQVLFNSDDASTSQPQLVVT